MTHSCQDSKPNTLLSRIMPSGVHLVCGLPMVARQRQKVVPFASGDVVEIGFGSGLNLPHYDRSLVRKVIGINPDDGLPRLARRAIAQQDIPAELLVESAEAMSLSSHCADSVVVTYSLCSIPNVAAALSEAHRVLKPFGRLYFCEHGRSETHHVSRLQDVLTPPWRWMASGCHLNRDVGGLIQAAGFELERYDIYDLGFGSRIIGTHHVGVARRR
ncbi:class I SAM-dependent methyltransferase [Cohaesibacter celericrescens]|uniref:class I SAM-dependent methyltransferase n=1 Tax=Cohaesibacter celericrescens TaxID=2067669 RepID=UPI003564081D